ncbi:hypothetical protein AYR72_gp059 [Cnaphalocrocis medinalis granulovirus]|uniref:ORF66 n=1 Tax=Cnaphalocrocis medinalis granulovirus TaxID=1750712 RepID=A0A120L148_9BBAC|nr:hypothetical protein AYR72_gp059 [Cnaphalocrocis medinalis granulovirus]ALN41999.1 ORF66 [Cnaphalocrocis medinalis granulovirus]AMF83810.1 hypothetical protein [Cnaphalocrocis medinalis granulovirus]WPN08689.1 hypothetical protein [Cnaphalocrocis medinalis granulovirus]
MKRNNNYLLTIKNNDEENADESCAAKKQRTNEDKAYYNIQEESKNTTCLKVMVTNEELFNFNIHLVDNEEKKELFYELKKDILKYLWTNCKKTIKIGKCYEIIVNFV